MKLLSSHLYWGIRFSTRFDKWFAPSLTVQSLFYTSFNQKKVFFSFCRNMNLMLFIPLLKGNLLNSKFLSLALSIDTFQKAIHTSFTRTVRINETLVKHIWETILPLKNFLRQVSIHRRSTFFLIIVEFCCADFCCLAARFGYCLYCLVVEVGRCHKSGMCHEMHLVNLITYTLKYK